MKFQKKSQRNSQEQTPGITPEQSPKNMYSTDIDLAPARVSDVNSDGEKKSFIEKLRDKYSFVDHLMLMQERYGQNGGNQFAAGITYFSILSMIPILMLLFAAIGFFLANQPDLMQQVDEGIDALGSTLGPQLQEVIKGAIEQRASVGIIGLVAAVWTGMSWINNLRIGTSAMWEVRTTAEKAIPGKISDFLLFIGMLILLIIAAVITALGSTSVMRTVIHFLHMDTIPGIENMISLGTTVAGVLANFLVLFFLMWRLPRRSVPWRPVLPAAIVGAIILELVKMLASPIFESALRNPAGKAFGPIIGLMLMFYVLWRILLYCSAWAATSKEGLQVIDTTKKRPVYVTVINEQ